MSSDSPVRIALEVILYMFVGFGVIVGLVLFGHHFSHFFERLAFYAGVSIVSMLAVFGAYLVGAFTCFSLRKLFRKLVPKTSIS